MGSSPALVFGVESLGKALNTNFLVLSETDVKFGGPVYLLSAVHVKNPLVVCKIVKSRLETAAIRAKFDAKQFWADCFQTKLAHYVPWFKS